MAKKCQTNNCGKGEVKRIHQSELPFMDSSKTVTHTNNEVTSGKVERVKGSEGPTIKLHNLAKGEVKRLPSVKEVKSIKHVQSECEDKPKCTVEKLECCDKTQKEHTCKDPKEKKASSVAPTLLDWKWFCSVACNKIRLFGSKDKHLAHFKGEGFLYSIGDGLVELKESLTLKATHWWHDFWQFEGQELPQMGNAMPAPALMVGDVDGNAYLWEGPEDKDVIVKWNSQTLNWEQREQSALEFKVKKTLDQSPKLNILGITPLADGQVATDIERCAKELCGEGIVVLSKETYTTTETIQVECEDGFCFEEQTVTKEKCVAEALPYPTGCDENACYILSHCNGKLQWKKETDSFDDSSLTDEIESLKEQLTALKNSIITGCCTTETTNEEPDGE